MIKIQHNNSFAFGLTTLTKVVLSYPKIVKYLPTLFCKGRVCLPSGVQLSLVRLSSQRFYGALAASRKFQLL
jgi:hypothetical protein